MSELATPATTQNAFLGGRLTLEQPAKGHRAGIDAVFLAAAAPVTPGCHVLDAGCGMGVVGLCIAARVPGCRVTGIEQCPELTRLANANASRNGLGSRVRAVAGDVTAPHAALEALGITRDTYDVVVANPPFFPAGSASASDVPAREAASLMPEGGLDDWLRFMTAMAAPGGRLAIVHRAEALGEILDGLDGRAGAVCVYPLYPRKDEAASRVIVTARKGSRAGLSLKQGMVLHGEGNGFMPEAEAILRHGEALVLLPRRGDG